MNQSDWLAERFAAERGRLAALAFRMLGSPDDAEDAVQEAWIRLTRVDADAVDNLGGWLTTVVSRVCLDQLRARRRRDDQAIDETLDLGPEASSDLAPEHHAVLAESVGLAMQVVLDTLEPAERVAFVLHDMFAVSFDQIAVILDRSPAAARQLASRARRRVQGAEVPSKAEDRQRHIVDAFLAASRQGDFEALLALLDSNVVLRPDKAALELSASRQGAGAPDLSPEVRGADAVAHTFVGRAAAARPALVGGTPGASWAPGGTPRVVFRFVTQGDRISAIELIADPVTIHALDVVLLPSGHVS